MYCKSKKPNTDLTKKASLIMTDKVKIGTQTIPEISPKAADIDLTKDEYLLDRLSDMPMSKTEFEELSSKFFGHAYAIEVADTSRLSVAIRESIHKELMEMKSVFYKMAQKTWELISERRLMTIVGEHLIFEATNLSRMQEKRLKEYVNELESKLTSSIQKIPDTVREKVSTIVQSIEKQKESTENIESVSKQVEKVIEVTKDTVRDTIVTEVKNTMDETAKRSFASLAEEWKTVAYKKNSTSSTVGIKISLVEYEEVMIRALDKSKETDIDSVKKNIAGIYRSSTDGNSYNADEKNKNGSSTESRKRR